MTGQLLYITGRPCSGKSTLAAALVAGNGVFTDSKPFAHRILLSKPPVLALGHIRDDFSGTDTLAMNVQPLVLEWMGTVRGGLVLGEGDRLATDSFLDAVVAAGWELAHVHLDVSDAEWDRRMRARAWTPDEGWLRGRITKAIRMRDRAGLVLDAARPVDELVGACVGFSPVAGALRSAALG